MSTTNDNAAAFYCATGVAGTFTEFATIMDIEPNKISIGKVKKTHLKSVAEETQASKTPDYGSVSITAPYDAALVTLVNGWIDTALSLGIKYTVEDFTGTGAVPSQTVFLGHVENFEPFAGTMKRGEDNITVSKITFKVAGKPVFTAGHAAV